MSVMAEDVGELDFIDVVALGELLIDFLPDAPAPSLAHTERFVRAAGGAPANVAVGLARLGRKTAFLGKVGNDPFGHFLRGTLANEGVDVTGLREDDAARTALAFVSHSEGGERDFVFYRHPSADMLYTPDEVDAAAIANARVLHVGSISLISEPSRSATLHALEVAKRNGVVVSYDPNLRLPLWENEEAARAGMLAALPHANVVKVSLEELEFITGSGSLAAARDLWHGDLQLLVVTLRHEGAAWFTPTAEGRVPGVRVEPRDTTGAGDAFVAAMLDGLVGELDRDWTSDLLKPVLSRANAYAAMTVTRLGAIPALPNRRVLEEFLADPLHAP